MSSTNENILIAVVIVLLAFAVWQFILKKVKCSSSADCHGQYLRPNCNTGLCARAKPASVPASAPAAKPASAPASAPAGVPLPAGLTSGQSSMAGSSIPYATATGATMRGKWSKSDSVGWNCSNPVVKTVNCNTTGKICYTCA